MGGWGAGEHNLSHEGTCWIYDNSQVFEDAQVNDSARVMDNAKIYGHGRVNCSAQVANSAMIFDHGHALGNCSVQDSSRVYEYAVISGSAGIGGKAEISGRAMVQNNSYVAEQAKINGNALLLNAAQVHGDAFITDEAVIHGSARFSRGRIVDRAVIGYVGPWAITWSEKNKVTVGCQTFTIDEWLDTDSTLVPWRLYGVHGYQKAQIRGWIKTFCITESIGCFG